MRVCPRSLLLGLLIILYLQSCAEGQNANQPGSCCFNFFASRIPLTEIIHYKRTRPDCTKPGVIFYSNKGPLCMDPSSRWVKRAMGIIDRRFFDPITPKPSG